MDLLLYSFISGSTLSCLLTFVFKIGAASNGRSSGLAGHPVFFGALTATASIMTLQVPFQSQAMKFLRYPIFFFLLYSLSLSASSTGFVVVSIGILGLFLKNIFQLKILKAVTGLSIGLIAAIFFMKSSLFELSRKRFSTALHPSSGFSTDATSGTSTFQSRLYSIKSSWVRIQDSPILGHGLDSFGRLTQVQLEPHNIFFLAWQTGGLLLFVIILLFGLISTKYFVIASVERQFLPLILILTGWLVLITEPLIYETSVLAPIYLGFFYCKNAQ
jgi:O-antigen ligase